MPIGSCTLANMRLSLVNGTAFVDFSAAGTLTPYLNGKLTLTDSAGKKAIGYIHHNLSDDPFVQMIYAPSSGITVADNDNIDVGAGNSTLAWKGSLPDWTPSVTAFLYHKHIASVGYALSIRTSGVIRLSVNATYYESTVATNLSDGSLNEITAVLTKETASDAGSVIFYVNGAKLGDTVTITAGVPATVSNANPLYIQGEAASRTAGIISSVTLYNRALTAAEVLSLYQSGIADEDKWGNQTAVYSSNFTSTVDSWTMNNDPGGATTAFIYNTNKVNLAVTVAGTWPNRPMLYRAAVLSPVTTGQYYRISITYTVNSGTCILAAILLGGTISNVTKTLSGTGTYSVDIMANSEGANPTYAYLYFNGQNVFNIDISSITVTKLGATLALEPEGINLTGWQDSSTNNLDASYPASGYSVYPDGTGARITNTPGGTTYNWASIEAGFNYNDASGYTYNISLSNEVLYEDNNILILNFKDCPVTNATQILVDVSDYNCNKLSIEKIWHSISGIATAILFDATTDDTAIILGGNDVWTFDTEFPNPKSTGFTGDLNMTISGAAAGDSYNIILRLRKY